MTSEKKVKEVMIPLEDYPHIPYWFSLRQAMAIVREEAIEFENFFEFREVLVFDEKYQLMGILTLRDIIKGLAPRFLHETALVKSDPSLIKLIGDLFGPGLKEAAQKPVSEVIQPIKVSIQGDDPIAKAIFLMITEDVDIMPVIQGSKLAGMVRMSDLFGEISQLLSDE